MTKNRRIDFYANGFLEHPELPYEERIGLGLVEFARYTDISFNDYILPTVECFPDNSGVAFMHAACIKVRPEKYDELIERYPEEAEGLRENRDAMLSYLNFEYSYPSTDIGSRAGKVRAGWGGGWGGHANPDFGRLINLGTEGIRRIIEEGRAKNPGKDAFYNGCSYMMDAVDILGERFLALARELAAECTDPENKRRYEAAARAFEVIPKRPAYDFTSAVHAFWLVFSLDAIDSPGRLDQMLRRCYEATDDREEIHDMLSRLWDAFHETRAWHATISGSDENRNDETFGLTYDILAITAEKAYNTPNLSVRVHRNTPEKLWRACAEVLATGCGLPTIYNDEVVCAAFEKMGMPACDSHDYCMNGCNQIDIFGKSHMGLEDGEVCLAKCVELALYNGCDPMDPIRDRYSVATGDATRFKTFDELMNAVKRQISWVTFAMASSANASQHAKARYGFNPLRSSLIEGCLERGVDYRNGGPLYNHGQILAEGIADAGDSLYAIKKLVFDEKKYTMETLLAALDADFEGYAELYRDFSSCEKFGNDIAQVDEITAEITNYFLRELKLHRTYRGGIYMGGCSPEARIASYGKAIGALPNGKRRGAPMLADSISATPGCDMQGPTAAVRSALRYDQTEAGSGFIFQVKFEKKTFCTEKGRDSFINLAKTYFAGGGQQITTTVVSADELRDAKEHPEAHESLKVRIGGYSGYFNEFDPELQDNIIARTEHNI